MNAVYPPKGLKLKRTSHQIRLTQHALEGWNVELFVNSEDKRLKLVVSHASGDEVYTTFPNSGYGTGERFYEFTTEALDASDENL